MSLKLRCFLSKSRWHFQIAYNLFTHIKNGEKKSHRNNRFSCFSVKDANKTSPKPHKSRFFNGHHFLFKGHMQNIPSSLKPPHVCIEQRKIVSLLTKYAFSPVKNEHKHIRDRYLWQINRNSDMKACFVFTTYGVWNIHKYEYMQKCQFAIRNIYR